MNMKKTIAAIAAGAVAVSAMATTVSALESKTYNYKLVNEYVHTTPAGDNTAAYEFTFQGVAPTAGLKIDFDATSETVTDVVIKVASSLTGDQNKIFTYSTNEEALNYNSKITKTGNITTIELPTEVSGYDAAAVLTLTVQVNTKTTYGSIKDINNDLATKFSAKAGTVVSSPVTLKAFTKAEATKTTYAMPFKTTIKNNANITRYLQDVKGYKNVGAVLNDAIENYDNVTFVFNTATQGIKWVEADYSKTYSRADLNGMKADPSFYVAYYSTDDNADKSYMAFDQHLYWNTTGLYGSYESSWGEEATGYEGFDWDGYNLFQGALVINENLTMSLAETDYFDWTMTSLSFDWDAIKDGAMTANDYSLFLHSMKLATSNTWYWDSMDVVLTAGAADDVEAEAGVEADDEELTEEPVEEEVVEEEVEEEPEVEVEVANPTTGNASVALAVIPVALAAAAVIAKKRS